MILQTEKKKKFIFLNNFFLKIIEKIVELLKFIIDLYKSCKKKKKN